MCVAPLICWTTPLSDKQSNFILVKSKAVGHKRFSNNGAKYVEGNGGTASASSPNQPTLPIFLPLDLPGHQQWCGDQ